MINVIISGCSGQMGQAVTRMCKSDPEISILAGFDINTDFDQGYPVYSDPMKFKPEVPAILIDFSNSKALASILAFCVENKVPPVLCTTGYSEDQLRDIKAASDSIAIFKSPNMSLGITLLKDLITRAASVLGLDYDIEIVEMHHRRKLDAPSGTAIMLADAAAAALPCDTRYVYERQSERRQRETGEIGISSVRGGTIVGEHDVIFAGTQEVIELKHTAYSREVFAAGAVRAAKYMSKITEPGMYDMSCIVSEIG